MTDLIFTPEQIAKFKPALSRQRIDVHTRNLANLDEPPTQRRIDWTHEGRDWLTRHLTYAMRTGRSVTLSPVGE